MFGKEKNTSLEVFNDIDSNLINLYRCVKYHPQELQKELNTMLISREQFFDCKNQLQINGLTDIQRAEKFYKILNNKDNANYFSKEDHIRLFEVVKKIKGKFILSYNNDEFIRNIYKNYKITYVERLNNLNFKNKKTNHKELIITNF